MVDAIVEIGGIAAFFAVFDVLARDEHKRAISDFLFARRHATFRSFETNAIRALMEPFLREGKLLPRRILVLSFTVCTVMLVFSFFLAELTIGLWQRVILYVTAIPVLALLCWPFDVFSLYVTRRMFIDRAPMFPMTVLWVICDLIVSIAPVLAGFVAIGVYLDFDLADVRSAALLIPLIAFYVNGVTSTIITILQVLTLAFGTFLRVILSVFRLFGFLADPAKLAEFPFTAIGLLTGVMTTVAFS
jgi:hypothetical protein